MFEQCEKDLYFNLINNSFLLLFHRETKPTGDEPAHQVSERLYKNRDDARTQN